jgi:hypothetical protein
MDASVHSQPPTPETNDLSIKSKALTFPQKLMQVLSNEAYSDIISWLPHGNSFAIRKTKPFVKDILPKHFKQAKYASFTRKLRRWGFQSILRGNETGAFYHEYFKRDNQSLCKRMTCSSNNSYETQVHFKEAAVKRKQDSRTLSRNHLIKVLETSNSFNNFNYVHQTAANTNPLTASSSTRYQLTPLELSLLSHYCPSSFEPRGQLYNYLHSSLAFRQSLLEKLEYEKSSFDEKILSSTFHVPNNPRALYSPWNKFQAPFPDSQLAFHYRRPIIERNRHELSRICTTL